MEGTLNQTLFIYRISVHIFICYTNIDFSQHRSNVLNSQLEINIKQKIYIYMGAISHKSLYPFLSSVWFGAISTCPVWQFCRLSKQRCFWWRSFDYSGCRVVVWNKGQLCHRLHPKCRQFSLGFEISDSGKRVTVLKLKQRSSHESRRKQENSKSITRGYPRTCGENYRHWSSLWSYNGKTLVT